MLSKHLMCQNIVELESRKVSNLKLTDPSPENIKVHNNRSAKLERREKELITMGWPFKWVPLPQSVADRLGQSHARPHDRCGPAMKGIVVLSSTLESG